MVDQEWFEIQSLNEFGWKSIIEFQEAHDALAEKARLEYDQKNLKRKTVYRVMHMKGIQID